MSKQPPTGLTFGDAWRGLIAGISAAVVAGVCTHPVDLIKVRMQLRQSSDRAGILRTGMNVMRAEGAQGLLDGLSGNVMRQTFMVGSRLGAYNVLKCHYEDPGGKLSFGGKVGCGVAAGAIGAIVGNPADLCMVRMQADGQLPINQRRGYRHALDALVRVVREEGPASLWKGTQATINHAMVLTAAQMSVYDQTKDAIIARTALGDTLVTQVAASLVAGGAAALAANPFDVAKTRLQNMKALPDGSNPYAGTMDCMAKTVQGEGFRALYKGLSAMFARQAPLNVIRFVALERFNRFFERIGKRRVILEEKPRSI